MKKQKIKLIALGIAVLVIIAAAAVLILNKHYIFIAGEYIGVNCDKIELAETVPDGITRRTLDELRADSRVTFDESMMLVNTEYVLRDDFAPAISEYNDTGVLMNDCMKDAYASLSAAVSEKFDVRLLVSSDYRTAEEQANEYNEAPAVATVPGASEHQTGLALDVYVPYYASYGFIKTDAGQFVDRECWKYGFIIRYPVYGKSSTGIPYEPWHLRYVGAPHAKIIYNNRMTLEKYIKSLEVGKWYDVDGYLISRQTLDDDAGLDMPSDFAGAVISPDNTGYYIITVQK